MAKVRKKRQRYTNEQREKILAAAKADKLTAAQVEKKFGVTPVTYYSWRKKGGLTRKRGSKGAGARAGRRLGDADLTAQVRSEVQAKMREIIPGIVRSEVSQYLSSVFRAPRRRKRRA